MSSTTFYPGVTPITADWLNGINNAVYSGSAEANPRGTVTAISGQTVFTVPFTYDPTVTKLSVFINGIHQLYTESYAQTNSTTVTFTEAVPVGAVVEFVG
jgi:hypothetical protein